MSTPDDDRGDLSLEAAGDEVPLDEGLRPSTLAEMVAQLMVDAKATRSEHIGEIGNLLQEPNLDQSRALEMVRQKTEIINQEAPRVIASLAIFLDSLSDEQKQQLQQFIEKRHHRHGDHQ